MPKKSAPKRSGAKKSAAGADSRQRPKAARKKGPRKDKPAAAKSGPSQTDTQRLQRLLALSGFGSRRQCEELIEAGRVEVDGEIITKLGSTVDPKVNKVRVDGTLLKKQRLVYYAVNKPVGVVTTNRDPQGRPRVIDLVPRDDRVFPVGRLDRNSEGLILLTNDGELAQKLTHPRYGVKKVYRVTVAGKVDGETMKRMRKGIYIAEGHVQVDGARLLKSKGRATELEIVLREGKNREIRRILARLGHKVQHLRRIAVGPLRLGEVPAGAYRVLSREEVRKLWEAADAPPETDGPVKRKKSAGKSRPTSRLPGKGKRKGKGKGKKSNSTTTKSKRAPAGSKKEFTIDSSRTGAVIGGDPVPESTKSRPGKRGAKKRSSKKGSGPKRKSVGRKRKR